MATSHSACVICAVNDGSVDAPHGLLYADALWVVRHMPPPYGIAGWLTLQTRRHCPEPAAFTDAEAASFGPALRHFEAILREVTAAERIYTAALGESVRHFHCHMVPRRAGVPAGAVGWGLFDLERQAAEGLIAVDPHEVARIADAFRARVSGAPRPT